VHSNLEKFVSTVNELFMLTIWHMFCIQWLENRKQELLTEIMLEREHGKELKEMAGSRLLPKPLEANVIKSQC